jgi:hypothetical protein
MALPIEGGKQRRRKKRKDKPSSEVIQKSIKPAVKKDTVKSVPKDIPEKAVKDTAKLFVPVPEWVGGKFILLEKTKVFRKFGYKLYTSPQLSRSKTPVDPKIELKNHCLKYDPFCKKIVTVTSVEKDGQGEYLGTFKTDTPSITIYGKTADGVIEGLAMVTGLQTAQKRWIGKNIYCRRRYLDIYDSLKTTFTSTKVPVTEPLKVVGVRWGVIPLPPKLLWLIVERSGGFRGIIPVNATWTNVIKFEKQVELPWEHELFDKNPKEIYKWDAYIWETIDKHNIFLGMTPKQVGFSWGEPKEKSTKRDNTGKYITIYKYDGKTLVFENNKLVNTAE